MLFYSVMLSMPEKTSFESSGIEKKFGTLVGHFIKQIPKDIHEFLKGYFRLEISGWENIPENSRAIVVSNHSNAMGMDAFMLGYCLKKKYKKTPYTMAHEMWFANEVISDMMRVFGLFPPDLREGLNALKNDKLVVIFPEGPDGNFKVSSNMYKLVDFNPGFVPMAIMQKAPVIPAVVIGAEESHLNLAKFDEFRDIIKLPIPFVLNLIPFPVKWKIKFLKPIDFSKYSKNDIKNEKFVREINQNIRYRIQHEINKELKHRQIIFR